MEKHLLLKYAQHIECVESQLFGKPSLKVGKRHFACFFKEALAVKLGADTIQTRSSEFVGNILFDPSGKGRPMKDWLQISNQYETQWAQLISEAHARATESL